MEGDETWALLSRDSRPGGEARRAFRGALGQRLGLRPATDGPGVGVGRWGGAGEGERTRQGFIRGQCLGQARSCESLDGAGVHTEAEAEGRQVSWI